MQIEYSGVDNGLNTVLTHLLNKGVEEQSRNGPVLRFTEPVLLKNHAPINRVSFNPHRDANPFFHFMEAMWMLAGMNELAPMTFYNSGMSQYSDDGMTLRGTAYGRKWRSYFGYDQLELVIARISSNPEDRRIVMTMWDPYNEWKDPDSKDISCNLQILFSTRLQGGQRVLDMTVTNRSNDIIYGCLGSNVFHFSMLQEFVAFHTDLVVGNYYQFANNLHAYTDNPVYKRVVEGAYTPADRPYKDTLTQLGMTLNANTLREFVTTGAHNGDAYLKEVGVPIYEAYRVYKLKAKGLNVSRTSRISMALAIATECADESLSAACQMWLNRKLNKTIEA